MSSEAVKLCKSRALRSEWYVVADAADVADVPVTVKVLGVSFVLWRDLEGKLIAVFDRCPHRHAPLSGGVVRDGCLVCPYHFWKFDAEGTCVNVPSLGARARLPASTSLAVMQVRELYGLVWLCPGVPTGEPPRIVEDDDASFRRINAGKEVWKVAATRMIDNFCDVAHFPFVHAGTIGDGVDPVVAPFNVVQLDAEFVGYEYTVDVLDEAGETIRQRMSTGFHLPFTIRSNTHYESGSREGDDRVLLLCATPIDEANSLFTFVVWRNHDHDVPAEDLLAFDRAIGAEDKLMLEQIEGGLPLDNSATVSVRSDRLSVEWRRRLAGLLDADRVRDT